MISRHMEDRHINQTTETPLLEMRGIHKAFTGVRALKGVDLTLRRGEVLALLGENGAGKSTLIKVLGGAHVADAGEIAIEGERARIHSPQDAQASGVSIIYQEFNLIPWLTVRENIFLGREKTTAGFIRRGDEYRGALELFERIGLAIDPETPCKELTVAQQQTVEIAKALSVNARIIVMDEPSAALTSQEVEHLFEIIRELKAGGMGVVYISHRLDEVFEIADRAMVMRDGELVGVREVEGFSKEELIEMMVGRPLEDEFPERTPRIGSERLRVEGLTRGDAVRDVSFSVHAGEILGVTGLVGAGRTETMRLVFGADRPDAGEIFLDGRPARIGSPREAIRRRIGLLTEDRKAEGLILLHSVRENFGLPNLDTYSSWGMVRSGLERSALAGFVDSLRIKLPDGEETVGNLSGGNQQKVVLAKWLERNCDIIIFDEPTRGIDVGTKYEIYLLMNRLAAEGKAIVMVSSELPEVLGMSDRILVMHEGVVKGEITDVASATQEQILHMAIGGENDGANPN